MIIDIIKNILEKYFPLLLHLIYYYKGSRRMTAYWRDINSDFQLLISRHKGDKCLQIGARREKYSDAFVCVDLHDQNDYVDFHYDVHSLEFDDDVFDLVVCNAILEHVIDPRTAIAELGRVLKPGGEIWVEVPFNQPYHPCPHDYWRVTVPGLCEWMKAFKRIDSGVFGNMLYNGVYYYGCKE